MTDVHVTDPWALKRSTWVSDLIYILGRSGPAFGITWMLVVAAVAVRVALTWI